MTVKQAHTARKGWPQLQTPGEPTNCTGCQKALARHQSSLKKMTDKTLDPQNREPSQSEADSLKVLKTTADLMSEGILLINKAGRIVFTNEAALRYTQLDQSQVVNQHFSSLLKFKNPRTNLKTISSRLESVRTLTLEASIKQEQYIVTFLRIDSAPTSPAPRNTTILIAVLETEIPIHEVPTTPGTIYLQIIGHLTMRVAHDFNNSLTSIIGNAEVLEETLTALTQPDSQETRETLRKALPVVQDVVRQSLQMATFVKTLQEYARQQPQPNQTLDLNRAITETFDLSQRLLGRKITAEFLPAADLPRIYFDRPQIDHILFSLLVNSKEAMPNGGRITIETQLVYLDQEFVIRHPGATPGNYVRLSVTDTGRGMNPDTLRNVFQLFQNARKAEHPPGLSLPAVYAIVKSQGGYIDAESWPGKGTRFDVYLPLTKPLPHTTQITPEPPQKPTPHPVFTQRNELQGKPALIMIAEDQPDIQRSMQRCILKAGYRIHIASTGTEAFDLYQQLTDANNQPDLLISDLGLPGLDGRTLCKTIRNLYPDARLLLTSGYQIELKENRKETTDGFDFIQKPFESLTLLAMIEQLLTRN